MIVSRHEYFSASWLVEGQIIWLADRFRGRPTYFFFSQIERVYSWRVITKPLVRLAMTATGAAYYLETPPSLSYWLGEVSDKTEMSDINLLNLDSVHF